MMQGEVYKAIQRAAEYGDYDALLVFATQFNTPEAQALLREAIELARDANRQQLESIRQWKKEFREQVDKGAFDGYC